jgi:hypothetical protein
MVWYRETYLFRIRLRIRQKVSDPIPDSGSTTLQEGDAGGGGVLNRYTFDCGSSLAVVEDGQLPEELAGGHDGKELALTGHLHLPLLHHVDDAAHVPLLNDERALRVLHRVHHINNFLRTAQKCRLF